MKRDFTLFYFIAVNSHTSVKKKKHAVHSFFDDEGKREETQRREGWLVSLLKRLSTYCKKGEQSFTTANSKGRLCLTQADVHASTAPLNSMPFCLQFTATLQHSEGIWC